MLPISNFPKLSLWRKNPLLRNPQMERFTTFCRKPNVNRSYKPSSSAIGLWQGPLVRRHFFKKKETPPQEESAKSETHAGLYKSPLLFLSSPPPPPTPPLFSNPFFFS